MNIRKTNLRIKGSLQYGNNPNKIIIHHPMFYGGVEELNTLMINMGYSMIGYNYYIRKDGSIWEGRPVEAIGANCYGQNSTSIGVCFEGDYDKDKEMPQSQFNAGVDLIKHLMSKYKITEVNGHKAYYNTACPGRYFPLEKILEALTVTSYVKLDGEGYASYKNGAPGVNLIIRDYSQDIVRAFAWVDSDSGASWAFDINPPNVNYTKLYKNTSRVITKRNSGSTFSKGAYYKIKVKAYNREGKSIVENQIVLRVPV